jgi:hypothetical protein
MKILFSSYQKLKTHKKHKVVTNALQNQLFQQSQKIKNHEITAYLNLKMDGTPCRDRTYDPLIKRQPPRAKKPLLNTDPLALISALSRHAD